MMIILEISALVDSGLMSSLSAEMHYTQKVCWQLKLQLDVLKCLESIWSLMGGSVPLVFDYGQVLYGVFWFCQDWTITAHFLLFAGIMGFMGNMDWSMLFIYRQGLKLII